MKTRIYRSKIQGFSLIEMMVSMTLGLFMIGGLTTMYINSKGSDKTRREVSQMEENARTAFNALRKGIAHAGYASIYNVRFESPFVSESTKQPPNTECRNGGKLFFHNSLTNRLGYTKDAASDQITVAYLADNPDDPKGQITSDVLGGPMTAECSADPLNGMLDPREARIYNRFFVNVADGNLIAYGSRYGNQEIKVADNIENMQILYGVLKNGTTTYQNATDVETNGDWVSVTSVQIGLLVRGENDLLDKVRKGKIQLLDNEVNIRSVNWKRLLRVYTTTINLPNRINREL